MPRVRSAPLLPAAEKPRHGASEDSGTSCYTKATKSSHTSKYPQRNACKCKGRKKSFLI